MKPIITFLCAVLLTIASQVSGQNMSTSFSVVPLPGQPPFPVGSQLTVKFNVTNFTKISSVLLPIAYNSAVLRFDSIDNIALPSFPDTFATSYPTPGLIRINWFPSLIDYPDGFTIPGAGARLMTLRFTVIGNGTANINLTTSGGTPIEVVNSTGVEVFNNAIFQSSGSNTQGVSISGGSGAPPPPPLVGFKIIANTVFAINTHRICVPVTVNDFDNIILMQYAMHWDNTKLNYDGCFRETLPGNPTFNTPSPGTLLLSWEDPNLAGVTFPDGTRIYDVCFNTIGAPGTTTPITIDGLGFPDGPTANFAEAYNASSVDVWTTGGANGASGISDTVFVMNTTPPGNPVTFTLDKDQIASGLNTCVDLKVKNFTTVTEMEYQITYDASKVTLSTPVTIPATAINLLPANVTATVAGSVGTVKVKWNNAAGVTVADNTTILSLCFTANAANGTIVPINFSTAACPSVVPFSAFKKDIGGVPYKFDNGEVNIASTGPTLTPTPALCNLGATGSIALAPNGTATSYQWSGPNGYTATTQNLTNVPGGPYSVTVTYAGGSTATATVTVSVPTAISMTQTVVGVACFGDSNGSIDITPSGGTGAYTYQWSGPMGFTATTQDITGVKTGNYVVSITDANGCVFASQAVNIPSPQAISVPFNGIVITGVSCFGNCNGAINIAPSGGTAPYTYDWSNDGPENPDNDPQNVTGLCAGAFTVTITDSRGCSFTPSSFTISQPVQLAANFVKKEDVKCFDTPTGKAEITVTGGTGNKTYSWKSIPSNTQVSTDQNPTNLAPGTYNVTVTDGGGCTATLPTAVTIGNAPSAVAISHTSTPGLCFGQTTGSIDLTVSGGWGSYSYNWQPTLPAIQDPAQVSSGTYTVTVTDLGGCSTTHSVVVAGAQSAISIGSPVVSNVTCFGQGNGGVCINPTGGNGGAYQVAWSNTSLTGSCIGNLQGGSYAPTVTDVMGCTAVFNAITVGAPQEILLDTTVTAANPTGGVDLIVTGGSPNYTYQWAGQSGPIATTEDISGMSAGTYTVTVTDANGCSKIGVYTIPSTNVLVGVTATSTNSCNNDGCINLTLPSGAAAASPFTVSWSGSGSGSLPASADLTPFICGLAAGAYIVTVTASNGNTATTTANITQLQQATLDIVNTIEPFDDLHNGKITIHATFANCTFLWNTGSTAASLMNLDSGLYVVTVTNNTSGCTAVYQYPLARQYQTYVFLVEDTDNPTCASSSNGSIKIKVVGGNGPNYVYHWTGPNNFTSSEEDLYDLKPGSYSLTVTDESGVTHTHGPIVLDPGSGLTINNVNELSLTPGGTQVSGATTCDGEATVVFSGQSGNVNILWSNSATTANTTTLCGGAYSVTVTDAAGCSAVWTDALTAPAPIGSTSVATSPKCYGDSNGSAKVFPSGGIEPYTVKWSNMQFDQLIFANGFSEAISLAGGTYTVTITDANNVTQTATVVVDAPQQISIDFTDVEPTNFNSCDGERIAFVTGAAEPINFTWSSNFGHNGNTERAEGLCAGEVLFYVITDANGCELSVVDTVPYPPDGCFQVRPVLTPAEQDGNNDYTLITCIESANNTVEIYNRWGQLVFQTENYVNDPGDPTHCWTGFTRTGQSLPEGVYYYVLTYVDDKANQHQLKGHINLLK